MRRGSRKTWSGWRLLIAALTTVVAAGMAGGAAAAGTAASAGERATASAVKTSTKATASKKAKATTKKSVKRQKTVKRKATRSTRAKQGARKRVVKRRTTIKRVVARPATPTMGTLLGLHQTPDPLNLQSNVALVMDQRTHEVLFAKNSEAVLPIASITKVMTALVAVEARQPLDELLEVTTADIDTQRNSYSRLSVGLKLTREDMLRLALMSSENRAASALGRNYPGGISAFVAAMNRKAHEIGMRSSHFADATGLSGSNVSNAEDLARMLVAAYRHPIIREFSTLPEYTVRTGNRVLNYVSSNRLVRSVSGGWEIGLQKTGFINEAGHCLLMQARVQDRPVIMVFLDSDSKVSRFADAQRVRRWIETEGPALAQNRALDVPAAAPVAPVATGQAM